MANPLRLPSLHHYTRSENVRNRHHHHNSQNRRHFQKESLIEEELLKFYDEEGKVKAALYDTHAQEIANIFANSPKEMNSYTQLRHFYDEVISLQDKIEENPSSFEELLPVIRMLNAKAAYAQGRKKVSQAFVQFISESLKQVKTPKDMKTFKTFFEAIMGFYKATAKGSKS